MDHADVMLLAAVAHRCWCASMAEGGWHPGGYDPQRRTHDALVAFEHLPDRDRRATCQAIEALELDRMLAGAVEYDRGPCREFVLGELRPGLPVVWADSDPAPPSAPHRGPGEQDASDRGVVESWEVDPGTGGLALIRVRWASGELSEHYPSERELRRV